MMNEGACLGAEAARRLAQTDLFEFEPGLTDAEFARIEREYGFQFADDHRAFLASKPSGQRCSRGRADLVQALARVAQWRSGQPA